MSGTEHYTKDELEGMTEQKLKELFNRVDTVEDLADELGLVHKDDFREVVAGENNGPEEIEAFGTGVQQTDQSKSEIFGAPSEACMKERERLRARRNAEPSDFTTGIQNSDAESDGDRELTAQQRENLRRAQTDTPDDPSVDEFGTGVQGDTTREEHREREEQVELLAEALKRAEDSKSTVADE